MARLHHTKLVLWHAQNMLLGQNTVYALLLLVLMIACDSCLARADSAFLPSIMHTQSTTSRRTGRGDACVSLGCVGALKICNERWKEGSSSDASDISVQCNAGSDKCICLHIGVAMQNSGH